MLKQLLSSRHALPHLGRPRSGHKARAAWRSGDWPEARGPNRDGISSETGLIDKWALNGENFLWRAPYGGRSAPIVMGNRVYVQNPSGRGADLQERVMALDADTRQGGLGIQVQPLPERRAAAPRRLGVAGRRSRDRQHLRAERRRPGRSRSAATASCCGSARSARSSRRSPRTAAARCRRSSTATSSSSARRSRTGARTANRAHRFIALDKRTGDIVYVANPGGRPYDTAYAAPLIATINGMRLLIAGLGDGGIHAIKPQTGEKVWSFVAAKRAINTGVVVKRQQRASSRTATRTSTRQRARA